MTDQPNKPGSSGPPNLQSEFFNRARRSGERVTIFLMNGKKLTGRIRAFDRYTILLDAGGTEEVIFKHAVSTVTQSSANRAARGKPARKAGGQDRPRKERSEKGGPKPAEQPLSHRMDLSAFQGEDEAAAPAAMDAPAKKQEPLAATAAAEGTGATSGDPASAEEPAPTGDPAPEPTTGS